MLGYEAVAGIAVSMVTAILGQFVSIPSRVKFLLVLLLSSVAAVILAGNQVTAQELLKALAVVFGVASAGYNAVKYVKPTPKGDGQDVVAQ